MKRKREGEETATAAGTGSSRDGGSRRGYEAFLSLGLLLPLGASGCFSIEKCLDIVATLQAKKGSGEALLADFEVSEGIYSQARIEDTDSATTHLQKNLENAKASLEVLVADLQFLREQVTIMRVTIARVYNWDIHQKRIRQAGAPAKDS